LVARLKLAGSAPQNARRRAPPNKIPQKFKPGLPISSQLASAIWGNFFAGLFAGHFAGLSPASFSPARGTAKVTEPMKKT